MQKAALQLQTTAEPNQPDKFRNWFIFNVLILMRRRHGWKEPTKEEKNLYCVCLSTWQPNHFYSSLAGEISYHKIKIFSLVSQIFVTNKCNVQRLLTAKTCLKKIIYSTFNASDINEVFFVLCTIIQWMNGLYPTWYDKNEIFPQIIIHLG